MKVTKLIPIIIFTVIFLPLFGVLAADGTDEDVQRGAGLYLEAAGAMKKKDFSGAKAKYEEAAQYLSGTVQRDALRMAEFLGKMSTGITEKDLLKDSFFSILGEVKEEGRVWHFYTSKYDVTILHVAISGEKPLGDLIETIGADLFTKEQVIKNAEGYLSSELTRVPGAASRIRMWYCDKDDTTNIVYENYGYSSDNSQNILEWDEGSISDVFEEIKCASGGFSLGSVPMWPIVATGFVIIFLTAVLFIKKRSKVMPGGIGIESVARKIAGKKFIIIAVILIILLVAALIFYFAGL